jgi:hypothetical protein
LDATHTPNLPGENSQVSPNFAHTFDGMGRVSLGLGQPGTQSANNTKGSQHIARTMHPSASISNPPNSSSGGVRE